MTPYDRAQRIADCLDLAGEVANQLVTLLRKATRLAEDDYPHTEDALRRILGAAELVRGATVIEHSVWDGYAAARGAARQAGGERG